MPLIGNSKEKTNILMIIGRELLVAGGWLLVAGCWWLVAGGTNLQCPKRIKTYSNLCFYASMC